MSHVTPRSAYRLALAATLVLIVYGCLYPFRFQPRSLEASPLWLLIHSWPKGLTRRVAADAMVNILLYVPLGFFAQVLAGNRRPWLAAGGILTASLALSASIEMAQLFDATRFCSALDTTMNVTGAALGFAGALALRRGLERSRQPLPVDAIVLVLLWAGWQLWPLIPQISIPVAQLKLHGLIAAPFSVTTFVDLAAGAFVLGSLWEAVCGEGRGRWLLAGSLCLVPARLFVTGRSLALAELAGAAAGWLLWSAAGRLKRQAWLAPCLFMAAIVISGLASYPHGAPPGPFHWMPFQFANEVDRSAALIVVLRKAFLYGSAVWLLHRLGSGYLAAGISLAALLAVIEGAQTHIPGRTADITDPILALLMAGALRCTGNPAHSPRAREAARLRPAGS